MIRIVSCDDNYAIIKFSEKYDLTFDEFRALLNEFKINTYLFKYMKPLELLLGEDSL